MVGNPIYSILIDLNFRGTDCGQSIVEPPVVIRSSDTWAQGYRGKMKGAEGMLNGGMIKVRQTFIGYMENSQVQYFNALTSN
jgi:hypothetical protein